MLAMTALRLSIAFQLLLLTSAFSFSQESSQPALLKGVVADINGALITKAVFTVIWEHREYKAITSDTNENAGEYRFELPAGVYDIRIDSIAGFTTTRHSRIRVDAKSINLLNFKMYAKYVVFSDVPGATKENPSDHPIMNYFPYEYFPIPVSGADGIDSGLIRSAIKEESQANTNFKDYGKPNPSRRAGVTFTYNLFSVEADEIRIDNKTKEVLGCGNITVEVSGRKEEWTGVITVTITKGKVEYSADKVQSCNRCR
jgi:hypothetical protein